MFTGLIEAVGTIRRIGRRGNYRVLTIECPLPDASLQRGDSIACDGACLTVVSFDEGGFAVEASQETAAKTTLGSYRVGSKVNLERAMKLGDRVGGHLVSGHVDDTGTVDYARPVGESLELAFRYDKSHDSLVIEKGSVAVNGVSLTVNKADQGRFSVNLIPHTIEATTLRWLKSGDRVNLEFDMIGKYIMKMIDSIKSVSLTKEKLAESGW